MEEAEKAKKEGVNIEKPSIVNPDDIPIGGKKIEISDMPAVEEEPKKPKKPTAKPKAPVKPVKVNAAPMIDDLPVGQGAKQ